MYYRSDLTNTGPYYKMARKILLTDTEYKIYETLKTHGEITVTDLRNKLKIEQNRGISYPKLIELLFSLRFKDIINMFIKTNKLTRHRARLVSIKDN